MAMQTYSGWATRDSVSPSLVSPRLPMSISNRPVTTSVAPGNTPPMQSVPLTKAAVTTQSVTFELEMRILVLVWHMTRAVDTRTGKELLQLASCSTKLITAFAASA